MPVSSAELERNGLEKYCELI